MKYGESQKINCSTSCPQPEAGGLETTLSKELLHEEAQWKQFLVSNVSQNTVMHCYFTCCGEQMTKTANVSVFCECSRAPPPGQSLCLLNGCKAILLLPLGASVMAPTSLGFWGDKEQDPGHGLRICSYSSLAALNLLATLVLRLAQRRAIRARLKQI